MAREVYIPCEVLGTEGSLITVKAPRGAENPHLIYAEREDVVLERQRLLANRDTLDGLVKGTVSARTPSHLTVDVKDVGGWTLVTVPVEVAARVSKPRTRKV